MTTIVLALAAASAACGPRQTSAHARHADAAGQPGSAALASALERARAATAPFRTLDSAVAAGYRRDVPNCIQHQPHGAMGYHHGNRALMDDRLEVEKPEILVYSKTAKGYTLNGVEYVVPYSARGPDATPPAIMGQPLKRADDLKIWYLHVWLYEPNPNGLFADWNPNVKC
jgi:hypothetical protein